jgi:hypothetical protein
MDEDRRRDEDPGDDREPADPRHRARVDARAVGVVVDASDPRRECRDDWRQDEHDADGDEEAPERRRVLHERAERVREGHAAVIAGGFDTLVGYDRAL